MPEVPNPLDPLVRHEPRRTLPAHAGIGPGIFRAFGDHESNRSLRSRHHVRGEVVHAAEIVRRFLGAGAIAAISTALSLSMPRASRSAWRDRGRVDPPAAGTGDYWELNIARYRTRLSVPYGRSPRGSRSENARTSPAANWATSRRPGISLDIWARTTAGRVPEEILKDELKRTRRDTQGTAQVLLADGVRLMGLQQYQEAAERFSHALVLAKKAGIVNAYVAPNLAWLATALRCQAEQQPSFAPVESQHLVVPCGGRGLPRLRTARWLQNDLPHALREYAQILAMREIRGAPLVSSRRVWRSPGGKERTTSTPRRCWPTAGCCRRWGERGPICGWRRLKPPCARSCCPTRRSTMGNATLRRQPFHWPTASTPS